jgi:tRNA/tmRNA/rRNA uracil-C5-methylase (TrmA/RlmC/RlmD family)
VPEGDERMRLLDLFCGAGGAAMGWPGGLSTTVGVDIAAAAISVRVRPMR